MRGFIFLLCGLLLCGTVAFAQDSDNDGLPDALDRRPHVAAIIRPTRPPV